MIEKRFRNLWDGLQEEKPHLGNFLHEVRLKNLRGIDDLRVPFEYPVSVIAGGNGSGKSTALLAAACAYKTPGEENQRLVPSALFPSRLPRSGGWRDKRPTAIIDFYYSTPEGRLPMRWRRSKGWKRSYFGCPGAKQPERQVHSMILSNLSGSSEARSALSMPRLRTEAEAAPLNASQISFVEQMLPFRHTTAASRSSDSKNALFAQHDGAGYPGPPMSAGERAILRLARTIPQLKNALILIDEVEAGLHPRGQQALMLQLQQLALRNELQIIVTTRSPAVLDAVPQCARIFLERDEKTRRVSVQPPYRDLIQNALYGRPRETLNLLCEDAIAESILHGVFDTLLARGNIHPQAVRIGRDTGAQEFPAHAKAFKKFDQLQNFVFVLDGNQEAAKTEAAIKAEAGADAPKVKVLFLPGPDAPEVWIWRCLRELAETGAPLDLGISAPDLRQIIAQQNQIYDSASDTPAEIAKSKLQALADNLHKEPGDICRKLTYAETGRPDSDIQPLVEQLGDILQHWRANPED